MSSTIDSSALTSIQNAINSYSKTENSTQQNNSTYLSTISEASTDLYTNTRYKAEFEEKMKQANESEDTVEISEESLNALKNYVQGNSASETTSTGTEYTYDYMTLKKQREANQAAIDAEYNQNTQASANEAKAEAEDSTSGGTDSTVSGASEMSESAELSS